MGKAAVLVAVVLVCLIGACSGGDPLSVEEDSPESFFVELTEQQNRGQWEARWETLHPLHQELVGRNQYVDCHRAGSAPRPEFTVTKIIESEEFDDVSIGGTDETGPATAVTYEVEVSVGPLSDTRSGTSRVFDVDGEYRWTLRQIEEYENGSCPDES